MSYRPNQKEAMGTFLTTTLAALILVAGIAAPVLSEDDQDTAKKLKESGAILPLEAIVQKAQREYPGRILEVKLEDQRNRLIYELELLDESGVVWELSYDAKTGELIQRGPDD